jgi:hypothetical protein
MWGAHMKLPGIFTPKPDPRDQSPGAAPTSTAMTVIPPAPPSAPRPTLEAEVRAAILQRPELARLAGLSPQTVSDWIFGAARWSQFEVEEIARAIGLLTTPPSGLAVVRREMAGRIRRMGPDWGPSRLNRTPDRGVNQGEENPSGAAHASRVSAFVDGQDDALSLEEINEFLGPGRVYDPRLDQVQKVDTATSSGVPPGPWTGGSNVPLINEMVAQNLRERLKQLEALTP